MAEKYISKLTINGVQHKIKDAEVRETVAGITDLIPNQATTGNKLADKEFVNSSISTATATFRGTYNLVTDLGLTVEATHADIATALATAIQTADNNDYCFVQVPVTDTIPSEIASVERYKHNGTAWAYEYTLNNSGYTAEQWAAINSGITSGLVELLSPIVAIAKTLHCDHTSVRNNTSNYTGWTINELTEEEEPDIQIRYTSNAYLQQNHGPYLLKMQEGSYVICGKTYESPIILRENGAGQYPTTRNYFATWNIKIDFSGMVAINAYDYSTGSCFGTATITYRNKNGVRTTINVKHDTTTFFYLFEPQTVELEIKVCDSNNDRGCIAIGEINVLKYSYVVSEDLADVAFSGEYDDLTGKPDLTSYYLKTETYAKTEVDTALGEKADKATTLSGYGITDAKIENGVITLGGNTITPITQHQSLTNYVQKSQTTGLLRNDGEVDTTRYLTDNNQNISIRVYSAADTFTLITSSDVVVVSGSKSVTMQALYSDKANKADLATVATSGSYDDLSGKPTIPTVPTNVSAFINDAGYITDAGVERQIPIASAETPTSPLAVEIGKYYRLTNVGTLAIILPNEQGNSSYIQSITFLITTGASPAIQFTPYDGDTILYQENFVLDADTTYEVTALYNDGTREWTLTRVLYA